MVKLSKIWRGLAITLVAAFALLALATSLDIAGHRSFVVASGSMSPKIKTGSVVFDRQSANYKIGDVITFRQTDSRDTVTHRIVSVNKDAAGQNYYRVKGDANPAPDPDPVAQTSVVGTVGFSVPYIGYAIGFIKTLPGLMVLIIIPGTILVYRELQTIYGELAKMRAPKKKYVLAKAKPKKTAKGVLTGLLVIAAAAAVFSLPGTRANYSDTSSLTGITITTGTWN